jgi:PRTRC genetic system protein E
MLKALLPIAAKVDSVALTFSAKDGTKPTLVLLPNHAAMQDYPVLGRGLHVEADTVEELERKLESAITELEAPYTSVANQIKAFQDEAAATLKAAREKAKGAAASASKVNPAKQTGKPAIPPKATQPPAPPPPPSLFGEEPQATTVTLAQPSGRVAGAPVPPPLAPFFDDEGEDGASDSATESETDE